jgi:sporulation protein YlmC with PRC-barrel domain
MLNFILATVIAAGSWLGANEANAAAVSELIGRPVDNARGEHVGRIDDFIIDVRAERVLYAVVDAGGRYYSLPLRALDERLRLDMDLANAVARDAADEDPNRLRRAGRLIGQMAHEPPARPVGTIEEIRFDMESGRVERVVVETSVGPRSLAPDVLAHVPAAMHSPPLEPPPPADERSREPFVFEPSDERRRLHDPNSR